MSSPRISFSFWRTHISPAENHEVRLLSDPGTSEVSGEEQDVIHEAYARHGGDSRWTVVEYTRSLPEWTYPDGGALPIEYRDILKAAGKAEADIAAVEEALEAAALSEQVLV